MKKKVTIIFMIILVVALMFLAGCDNQEKTEKKATDPLVEKVIACYVQDWWIGSEEMEAAFSEMEAMDAELAKTWRNILQYWEYTDYEMIVNTEQVPDGLPTDDSMAIVVFGHVLNDDGTMQDELIGRLELGLALSKKYPNAFIVPTGGGTAKKNKNVTEGGLMAQWFLEQGVEPSRVIPEEKAQNTVGNVENVYEILKKDYPQVNSWVVVSSDHHVPRACVLSYTKCQLAACESGEEPVKIIANMGYESDYDGYESMELTATGVAEVAKVNFDE